MGIKLSINILCKFIASRSGDLDDRNYLLNSIFEIDKENKANRISIMPNLLHDIVNINNLTDDMMGIQIYHIRSQLTLERKVIEKNIRIDLSEFTSGLYNVIIINNNNEINSKHRLVKHCIIRHLDNTNILIVAACRIGLTHFRQIRYL